MISKLTLIQENLYFYMRKFLHTIYSYYTCVHMCVCYNRALYHFKSYKFILPQIEIFINVLIVALTHLLLIALYLLICINIYIYTYIVFVCTYVGLYV